MFKVVKVVVILFYLALSSYADETKITKEWLNEKPKSHIKDFYLWRYIEQNQNDDAIVWALSEANNANHKIFIKYHQKTKEEVSNFVFECSKLPTSELLKKDGECLNIGLSILEATNIKGEQLSKVIEKMKKSYLEKNEKLSIINSKEPFEALMTSSSNDVFFGTFNEVGESFRVQYFDAFIPQKMIEKLQVDTQKFQKMIKTIVTTPKITTIQQSLFDVDTKKIDFPHTFFLAMNAIKHERKEIALKYLDIAYKKATKKSDQDNVMFWQYQLTGTKEYIEELGKSWDINLYSVLAKEALQIPIHNIFYDIDVTDQNTSFNIQDPFLWRSMIDDMRVLNDDKLMKYRFLFNSKETVGYRALLEEKYNNYKISYFLNPYEEYIKDYSPHRQALINAIARQESRFMPASLSSSYAMGVMQIMPFLSKSIAKELGEPFDIEMQFDPKTNIRYANHHLNYLESKLANVLFVAYAYNGGIGFTTRMLQSGLFKRGPYEPFLSMELVAYDESKHYGKKVLVNYLLYFNKISEEKITLLTLLENLKSPYLK